MTGKHFTLLQLNALVRESIEQSLPGEYWVEAEISELRENKGHCYMQLIEKTQNGNTPVACASARCWRNVWMLLRPHFLRVTGQEMRPGLKVLMLVSPQFHENYGFSWIVRDVDPAFTLGDMARKRKEIIDTLKAEGVFDLNKQLPMPMFTQRIAVISSEGAAGYGDFCDQLSNNQYGLKFTSRLFPAIMQGEGVEQSVIAALNLIYDEADSFDAVVIIRGGGATSDLSGFDTLALAENVANFPLPVITGIGHDRDESVLDMVSHTRVKTPTAAAAFLVDRLLDVYNRIEDARRSIVTHIDRRMRHERLRLAPVYGQLVAALQRSVANAHHRIDLLEQPLGSLAARRMERERQRIALLQQRTAALDPALLLRRGYSITLLHGKTVRDASLLSDGDVVETRLATGTFTSIVTQKHTKE